MVWLLCSNHMGGRYLGRLDGDGAAGGRLALLDGRLHHDRGGRRRGREQPRGGGRGGERGRLRGHPHDDGLDRGAPQELLAWGGGQIHMMSATFQGIFLNSPS